VTRRLLPLALLLLAPLPLAAQGTLTPGRVAQGSISDADPVLDDGSHYDLWRLAGKARTRYRVTLRSSDFDAFLAVGRGTGEAFTEIASDDDAAGGNDAEVTFTAPADGEYVIRANTLREGETGAYSLVVLDEGQAPPLRAVAIEAGQAVSGTLDGKDQVTDDGKPVDYYRFTARAGRRYAVTMLSQAFDAFLEAGPGADGAFLKERSNDDGGGGTNARLSWVTTVRGEVWIAAHGLSADTGRYTLLLEDLGDAPPPSPPVALAPGRTLAGTLTDTDETTTDGPFDTYVVEARAGDTVVVRMMSTDFDPIVAIGHEDGEWAELDKDDDGGVGTDAHLEFVAPRTGRYLVHAYGVGSRSMGAYTIRRD
jgi:hypothetical protein